jgi:tetratricopeptide (TPR) repeat protein
MSGLKRLIAEIHRRSLWQVLGIYLVGAWIGYEIIQALTEGLGLPDWVPGFAVVIFIIGLPIVLATALVQEGAPVPSHKDSTLPPDDQVTLEARSPDARARFRRLRQLLTWRNAILAGLAMLALLAVSATGYMGLRAAGVGPFGTLLTKGVLEERDRIVLAEFEDHAGDSLTARALTEAFRTDLAQSRLITLVAPSYVAQVLARMERDPGSALDMALAREVAIRAGLTAVVGGEIISAGTGYVFTAQLVSAESGDVLAAYRETADDSTAILRAIDQLSKQLRQRIGESLRTIRGNRPLDQVTTGSLEALRKYSQGVRAIDVEADFAKGVGLLREAVALDTAFAMAYLRLGHVYFLAENRTRTVEAFTRAYRHRGRLTDRERYITIVGYYIAVTGEHGRAITVARTLLDAYPDDVFGLFLLGASYTLAQQFERAEEVARREIELDSTNALTYWVLLNLQVSRGEFQEARATLERMVENHNPYSLRAASWLAIAREDYEGAVAHLQSMKESQTESPYSQAWTSSHLAGVAQLRGKLAESEREFGEAVAAWDAAGSARRYLRYAVRLALLRLQLGDGVGRGLQTVEDALERHPLATIPVLDRPYPELAEFYAIAGRLDQARALVAEHDAAIDPTLRWFSQPGRHRAEGYIALAEGDYGEAIAEFRLSDDRSILYCRWCALPPLADAYDLAGEPDSAVAAYERFLGEAVVGIDELHAASRYLPSAYERLGALYEQRGDSAKAIRYYGKLVGLWKDADPELQARVEAARRAIEALSPDT